MRTLSDINDRLFACSIRANPSAASGDRLARRRAGSGKKSNRKSGENRWTPEDGRRPPTSGRQ